MRILLIDDNPDDRELSRLHLLGRYPDAGFVEVGRRDDLEPALARGGYDLIFLDYYLRWANGLDVLRALKGRMPDVPVIMLTDSGTEEVAIEGMKGGLCDYVLKSHFGRLPTVAGDCLEKARLRREHRDAQRRLAALVEELTEANRRKDEFLAMLGHELRNPLAPVLTSLHLILMRPDDPQGVREAAAIAERQVRHMAHLLDDLLDVSRVVRGMIALRKEPVDLATAMGRGVEAVRPLVEARGQTLTVLGPSRPVAVEADPTRLVQVFVNLLNNAAKYTDRGGSIWFSAESSGGEAVVRVRDTGTGIEPGLLPRVFDLFVQGRRDSSRTEGGLGIGLTLVRRLAELHGGTVEARSDGAGRGSELIVRLPTLRHGRSDRAGRPGVGQRSGEATPPARPLRILIVDDNEDAARSLARVVELWGHEAHCAHDGHAAVAAAEALQPQVILLDLGLPGLSGIEVAGHLRGRPGFERMTIIALTGYGQEDDRQRTRQAGFDAHLVKPVAPGDLESLLVAPEISPP